MTHPFDDAEVARELAPHDARSGPPTRSRAPWRRPRCRAPFEATGVTFDSRAVGKGDLFVALAGETHDGHDFVADALARGAAAAVVSRDVPGASGNLHSRSPTR